MSQVARASSPSKGSMPPKGILAMLAGAVDPAAKVVPPVRAESDGESEKGAEAAVADAGDQDQDEEEEEDEDDT